MELPKAFCFASLKTQQVVFLLWSQRPAQAGDDSTTSDDASEESPNEDDPSQGSSFNEMTPAKEELSAKTFWLKCCSVVVYHNYVGLIVLY